MLTLLLFFLFPPKNLLIWSIRPGFFFFLPSPKALCPEVLAVAMLAAAAVGGVDLSVYSVVLFQAIPKLTVPKPVSAAPSGWFAAHLTLRGCLWRCHPLGPRAPWDILRVRLVRVGGFALVMSMVLAQLQAFFGASVAVSVTAALRMGPAIVPLPICLTPAAGTTRVISESELTPWCKAARSTVGPLLHRPHISSSCIVFELDVQSPD